MGGVVGDTAKHPKSSFRGDAKHRTRNLEIPRCAIAHLRSGANAPSRNDGVWIASSQVLLAMTKEEALRPLRPASSAPTRKTRPFRYGAASSTALPGIAAWPRRN